MRRGPLSAAAAVLAAAAVASAAPPPSACLVADPAGDQRLLPEPAPAAGPATLDLTAVGVTATERAVTVVWRLTDLEPPPVGELMYRYEAWFEDKQYEYGVLAWYDEGTPTFRLDAYAQKGDKGITRQLRGTFDPARAEIRATLEPRDLGLAKFPRGRSWDGIHAVTYASTGSAPGPFVDTVELTGRRIVVGGRC